MLTYEVRGPDLAKRYWVVEIECQGAFLSETNVGGSYSNKERAQAATNKLNRRYLGSPNAGMHC